MSEFEAKVSPGTKHAAASMRGDDSVVEEKVRFFEKLASSPGTYSKQSAFHSYTTRTTGGEWFTKSETTRISTSNNISSPPVGFEAYTAKENIIQELPVEPSPVAHVPIVSSAKHANNLFSQSARTNLQEYLPQLLPTVFDAPNFDPIADAQALRKAMKGWGTDEATILDIITKRSNRQRQEIYQAFKKEFGRDLISDLKKELGGDFEDVIVGLMMQPIEYEATELRKAMKGAGTDEKALIEILLTKTNGEMQRLVDCYNSLYETTLDDRIRSETSGDLQRLLILAVSCARDEHSFNPEKAHEQAMSLYNAGEKKLGTDEETFVILLGHAGRQQLLAVFEEYKAISGITLEQAVKSEFSGDLHKAILTIIQCMQSRPRYYAKRLHKAMEGLGTDDDTLIRILVSRSEIDLGNIKKEYETLYGCTLLSAIKQGETSGDYKKALCAIVGSA
ncbi:annexin B10-like isoform X3 [Artemia franciscana]|uniref:annexin B10-like isoform X3 n=1 Tax=Artemia franciscana TaxID=6661 RepID=UPI0032DB46E1